MFFYRVDLCDLLSVGVLSSPQRPELLKGMMSPFQDKTLSWANMFYDKGLGDWRNQ